MIGRLGNQFFQYATLRAYMIDNNIEDDLFLNFDLCRNSTGSFFDDSLKYFNTVSYQEISKIHYTLSQLPIVFFIKVVEKLIRLLSNENNIEYRIYHFEKRFQKFFNYFGLFYATNGYIKFNKATLNQKNLVFYGFFESPKYFDHIKDTLLRELTPKEQLKPNVIDLKRKLNENKNSICISIRRGDFVTNEEFKKLHYVCDDAYFYQAIDTMNKKVKNGTYFVCSDDIKWCRENMKWNENTIFEEENNSLVEKIALMSSCNHFILSNSTFSWWVQYLSNQKNVVVAPNIWRKNDYTKGKVRNDIYEDHWILIGGSRK